MLVIRSASEPFVFGNTQIEKEADFLGMVFNYFTACFACLEMFGCVVCCLFWGCGITMLSVSISTRHVMHLFFD